MVKNIDMSKNDYVLLRSIFNEDLHNAVIQKDVQTVEKIITEHNQEHLKTFDWNLFDHNSTLDIDYIKAEHERELKEDNFRWALY